MIPGGVDQGPAQPAGGAMTKYVGDVPDDDVSGDSDDEVSIFMYMYIFSKLCL